MLLSTHFADQDAHRPLPGPPTGWPRRRREHLYSRPIGVKQNDPKNAFHTRQTRLKLGILFSKQHFVGVAEVAVRFAVGKKKKNKKTKKNTRLSDFRSSL